jgi:hypothetical protein
MDEILLDAYVSHPYHVTHRERERVVKECAVHPPDPTNKLPLLLTVASVVFHSQDCWYSPTKVYSICAWLWRLALLWSDQVIGPKPKHSYCPHIFLQPLQTHTENLYYTKDWNFLVTLSVHIIQLWNCGTTINMWWKLHAYGEVFDLYTISTC